MSLALSPGNAIVFTRAWAPPAGYVIATEASKSFDDPGHFIPVELVNLIRPGCRNGVLVATPV